MKQYLDLLKEIQFKGTWKEPARENMPRTLSLFGARMEFDMKDGFPLLTTKKMFTKAIFVELLWFIKGDTNIKYLVDNGCNIWNQDAYRWYLKKFEEIGHENPYSFEDFIKTIRDCDNVEDLPLEKNEIGGYQLYDLGDLGKVYGTQWRDQNGIDQLQTVIDRLLKDPMGRYAIMDAWNPSDFKDMALPPCHLLYQFNCREIPFWERTKLMYVDGAISTSGNLTLVEEEMNEANIPKYYLDLQMYQRSCDTFLGVPFNVASASLLLHLVAKIVNMEASKFIWVGGDTHIYENHLDQVAEQLSRTPFVLPRLEINKPLSSLKDLENLTVEDIKIINYNHHSKIKAELKTGL